MPGFGDDRGRILLVGLAPAAHGGNRTGRVFTGDASGDFLWRAMHAAGLANQPDGRRAGDGLELHDARVAAAVRCAPPANRPTPAEQATCRPYLVRELELLAELRVIVALGAIAWDAALRTLAATGPHDPGPEAAVRARRRDRDRRRTRSSAPTTRASRTRSPAGSRQPMLRAVLGRGGGHRERAGVGFRA